MSARNGPTFWKQPIWTSKRLGSIRFTKLTNCRSVPPIAKKLRNFRSRIFSLDITRSLTDGCAPGALGLLPIHEFPAPQLERDQSPQLEIEITAAIVHHNKPLDVFRIEDPSLAARA